MALNTTVGSKTANSFCTVVQADAYIAASLWSASDKALWTALSDSEVEALLKLAAIMMCGMGWIKYPVYKKQALPFPRWYVDDDGNDVYVNDDDSTVGIPDAIKKAQAYIAFDVVYRALQDRTSPGDGVAGEAIERLSLFGDVSIGFSKGETSIQNGSAWEDIISKEHWEIAVLIGKYYSPIEWVSNNERAIPDMEDEVA